MSVSVATNPAASAAVQQMRRRKRRKRRRNASLYLSDLRTDLGQPE